MSSNEYADLQCKFAERCSIHPGRATWGEGSKEQEEEKKGNVLQLLVGVFGMELIPALVSAQVGTNCGAAVG